MSGCRSCKTTSIDVLLENRTFSLDTPLSKEAYSYLTREFHIDLGRKDLVIGYRADAALQGGRPHLKFIPYSSGWKS